MRLFFIRHGQTTGDVEDRYGGAYDDLLSQEGERQVQALGLALANRGIQKIYSSPLKRAQQTANGLKSQLLPLLKVEVLDGLAERNQYGQLTGMVKAEAKQKYPDLVQAVKDRNNTLPGAESYIDAVARMMKAFNHIVAQNHACAAAVWHGGGMRALFREILKKGEIVGDCGDCCWVELEKTNDGFAIKSSSGLVFDF
jgi:probable phosphoglycerate mutase